MTDALGHVKSYTYPLDGNLAGVHSTVNHAGTAPTADVSFAYDPHYDRLTGRSDAQGLTTYAYHPAGQPGAGPVTREQTAAAWPEPNRLVPITPVDGATSTFAYDGLGRRVLVSESHGPAR